MKMPALIAVSGPVFLVTALFASPALANQQQEDAPQDEEQAPQAEVVKRDAEGRATLIRVEGREYAVCREGQQDGCINPREAGLDFGSVPIDYRPGRPASEIDEPLPAEPPEQDD